MAVSVCMAAYLGGLEFNCSLNEPDFFLIFSDTFA